MPFDPVSVAFLTRLQAERLGPRGEAGIREPDRIADSLSGLLTEEDRQSTFEILFGSETSLPTPYESFHNYSLLSDLALAITIALRKYRDIDEVPMVGTLPIGAPLAFLLRVPDSVSHIVLVDTQFAVFANLLAKAGAQALLPSRAMTKDCGAPRWTAGSSSRDALRRADEGDARRWPGDSAELPRGFLLAEPGGGAAHGDRSIRAGGAHRAPGDGARRHSGADATLRRAPGRRNVCLDAPAAGRVLRHAPASDGSGLRDHWPPEQAPGLLGDRALSFSLALLQQIAARHRGETRRVATRPAEQMAWMREVLRRMEGE